MDRVFEIEFGDTYFDEETNSSSVSNSNEIFVDSNFDIKSFTNIEFNIGGKKIYVNTEDSVNLDGVECFGSKNILDQIMAHVGDLPIIFEEGDWALTICKSNYDDEYFLGISYGEYGEKTFPNSGSLKFVDMPKEVTPETLDSYLASVTPLNKITNIDLADIDFVDKGSYNQITFTDLSINRKISEFNEIYISKDDNTVYSSLLHMVKLSDNSGYVGNGHIADASAEDTGENFCILIVYTNKDSFIISFVTTEKEKYSNADNFIVKLGYSDQENSFIYDDSDNYFVVNKEDDKIGISYESITETSCLLNSISSIEINLNGKVFYVSSRRSVNPDSICFGNAHILSDSFEDTGEKFFFAVDNYDQLFNCRNVYLITTEDIGDTVTQLYTKFNCGGLLHPEVNVYIKGVTADNFGLIKTALLNNPKINISISNIDYGENILMEDGFSGCKNLKKISAIPSYTTSIRNCFSDTGISESPFIPDTVITVDGAFNGCTDLEKVFWEVGNLEPSSSLFKECLNLKTINMTGSKPLSYLINYLNNGKSQYSEDFLPTSILPEKIITTGYYEGIKIDIDSVAAVLKSWDKNTIDNPYIIDVTNIKEEDVNLVFYESEEPESTKLYEELFNGTCHFNDYEILADRYISLVESNESVTGKNWVSTFNKNGYGLPSLVTVDISKCSTIQTIPACFAVCQNIKTIKLPTIQNIVTNIESESFNPLDSSFMYCSSLTEVTGTFSDNIESLDNTFERCLSLKDFPKLPANLKFMESTFRYSGIEVTPKIPDSVESMQEAFRDCHNLTNICNIPSSVTNLMNTFNNTKIKNVPKLPDAIVNMYGTFWGCEELVTITNIPKSVVNMDHCFENCKKLESCPDIITDNPISLYYTFEGCESLTSVGVIDNADKLEATFSGCSKLESDVYISGPATTMENTFRNTKIRNVVKLPDTVNRFYNTFYGCSDLEYINTLPSSLNSILNGTFNGCENLKTIGYWNAINSGDLKPGAFEGLKLIESITVENFIQKSDIVYLLPEGILLPPSEVVKSITDYVPASLLNHLLDRVKFLNDPQHPYELKISNVTKESLEGHLAGGYNPKSIQYALIQHPQIYVKLIFNEQLCDEKVTDLKFSFANCTSLVGANILNFVTSAISAFYGCSNLLEAPVIPESVKYLNGMFEGCSSLAHGPELHDYTDGDIDSLYKGCLSLVDVPNIPKNITSMRNAFAGCENLTTINNFNIPFSKFSLFDNSQIENAFKDCGKLTTIEIPVKKVSDVDNKWNMVVLKGEPSSLNTKLYNSSGELLKEETLELIGTNFDVSGRIDELVVSEEDVLPDEIINKMFLYKQHFSTLECLDPANSNFVLWAKDPDSVVSNILNGGGGGGTTVKPNPELKGDEEELTSIQIGKEKFAIGIDNLRDIIVKNSGPIGELKYFPEKKYQYGYMFADGSVFLPEVYPDFFEFWKIHFEKECGYDNNGYPRLPDFRKMFIRGNDGTRSAYEKERESAPNLKGFLYGGTGGNDEILFRYIRTDLLEKTPGGVYTIYQDKRDFDASRYSRTYGRRNEVAPANVSQYIYIKVI